MQLALADTQVAPVPERITSAPSPLPRAALPEEERRLLRLLRRRAALTCLRPRIEPFLFCAALEATPERDADACLDAVLRVAPHALGRRFRMHHPSAAGVSFDEAWLLGLLRAYRRGDHRSAAFALASRCRHALRRPFGALANGLATRLDPHTLEAF
ncbi:MAG: hypothetical protein ACFBWO_03685 [Paracoccaceae bacterium]